MTKWYSLTCDPRYTKAIFLSAKRNDFNFHIINRKQFFMFYCFQSDWQFDSYNQEIHESFILKSLKFLKTATEARDALSEKVTDHELLAAIWIVHHQSALGSESVVNETLFVTFQSNVTSGTVFEGTMIGVDFCVFSKCHCKEQIHQFHNKGST